MTAEELDAAISEIIISQEKLRRLKNFLSCVLTATYTALKPDAVTVGGVQTLPKIFKYNLWHRKFWRKNFNRRLRHKKFLPNFSGYKKFFLPCFEL